MRLFTLILDWIVKFLVFIIKTLHLTLPVLYSLAVFITNLIWNYLDNKQVQVIVMIGLGLCCLYTIFRIVAPVFKIFKPKNKENVVVQNSAQSTELENVERFTMFAVRENPNYVVKEFGNRFELYEKKDNSLIYVRTDYK